jgi:hypothetical protein
VISLSHPGLGGLPFATHTLWGRPAVPEGRRTGPGASSSPRATPGTSTTTPATIR